jgi:hypothetical protein
VLPWRRCRERSTAIAAMGIVTCPGFGRGSGDYGLVTAVPGT